MRLHEVVEELGRQDGESRNCDVEVGELVGGDAREHFVADQVEAGGLAAELALADAGERLVRAEELPVELAAGATHPLPLSGPLLIGHVRRGPPVGRGCAVIEDLDPAAVAAGLGDAVDGDHVGRVSHVELLASCASSLTAT